MFNKGSDFEKKISVQTWASLECGNKRHCISSPRNMVPTCVCLAPNARKDPARLMNKRLDIDYEWN